MAVRNSEVAKIFDRVGAILEIQEENPFRVRAYHNAARTIEGLSKPVAKMLEEGEDLSELRGIGKDLAKKIEEIVRTGSLQLLEKLEEEGGGGELVELTLIRGLGPKRVKLLHEKLGISTFKDLEAALKDGRVEELDGFGEKTQKKILEDMARFQKQKSEHRFSRFEVEPVAESLVDYLRSFKGVEHVEVAGSYRRKKESVGDLDILVTGRDGAAISEHFVKYADIKKTVSHGATRSTAILDSGLQVDLRVVADESFGSALCYFTGSKEHNIALRKRAIRNKLKINEYGVFKGKKQVAGKKEEDIYALIGLDYVEPELRENLGEIEAAENGKLPKLVEIKNIRGDLHAHTNATDGKDTLEDMVNAAIAMEYEYLAITDHSKRVTIAGGLDERELSRQLDVIDALNDQLDGFQVLKGAEVDILKDGSLDYSNEILKRLDVCVCAVHYNRNMSKKEMTERIIRGMDNPYFNILAHPSGRLMGEREAYDVDMERVMLAAKERGCFLEVNSQPKRLDLDDHYCKMAKDIGVKVAISTDSHSAESLWYMRLGVDQARRGWLESADVINTLPLLRLKQLLKR